MTVTSSFTAATRHHASAYCLRCYAPLEDASRPVEECLTCGFLNTRQARRSRWTLEPGLVALEWACKLAALVLCLGAYVYLALTVKGTPMGLILAAPAVFGVLWATSAKITHRMPYFKADVFWSAVVLVVGLLPAIGIFASALLFRAASGNALTALALAIPFRFLSRGVLLLGRRLDRWKQARIARGASLAVPAE